MKNRAWEMLTVILMISVLVSGCEVIGGIFKAGIWTGIIGIVLILVVIIWIIAKVSSKNKNG